MKSLEVLLEDGTVYIYDYDSQLFDDDLSAWIDDVVEHIENNKPLSHLLNLTRRYPNFYVFTVEFLDWRFCITKDNNYMEASDSWIELGNLKRIKML